MIADIDLIEQAIERTQKRINELREDKAKDRNSRMDEINILRALQMAKLRKLQPGAGKRAEIVDRAIRNGRTK